MPKGFLGLVIGNKRALYAYAQKERGAFSLSRTGVVSVEEESPSFYSSVFKGILTQENISPQKIFVSFFRDDVLTHQLTLPKMPKSEIEEVILGEIEKIPSFSEREFEYVYSSYELDERRVKVIFSTYFKSVIKSISEGIKSLKVPLESIELAPLNMLSALYAINEGKEDAVVVLDEKATYIMVVNKKKCRFFHVTGTGLKDLYIAKTGLVNTLTFVNWVDELKRIFKSYVIEYQREDIRKIWFVWDRVCISDLDEKLGSEMAKEVEILDAGLLLGRKREETVNPIYTLCVAPLVAYIRNLKGEISFEPFLRELKVKKTLQRVGILLCLYFFCAGALFFKVNKECIEKKAGISKILLTVNSQITTLENERSKLQRERSELIAIRKILLQQAAFVQMLNRVSWSQVFGEIATELPEELAFTSFKVAERGEVDIRGEALKVESVAEMMRRVENSSVLGDAKFDSLSEKKKEDVRFFSFGILAHLREETSGKK